MGNAQRAVFRIVERQDLVLCLLYQHREPNGQVGADHVHQPEPRHDLVPVHLDLLLDSRNGNTGTIIYDRRSEEHRTAD